MLLSETEQGEETEEGRRLWKWGWQNLLRCFSSYKGFFFFFLFVIIFNIFAILAIFIITLLMYNSHIIQFTHLKYTVPNSMVFSVCTELFSHYHGYFENVLIIADWRSVPISIHFHFPPPLPTLGSHQSISNSVDVPVWDISHKWNHRLCGPSWLAPFTRRCFQGPTVM